MTDDPIDELVVDVRAATGGFAQDVAQMRGHFDATLVDGFEKAGGVLEKGLQRAIRTGSLGFDDLKKIAVQALDQIVGHALQGGIGSIVGGNAGGGASGGGLGAMIGTAVGALFGLPGRATGGPVSPGQAYLVGERGPEVFVPTSSGRIDAGSGRNTPGRDVQVSIKLGAQRGASTPVAMKRSARQVASAVRSALAQA